ncbi:MAG: DUF2254 family protein [Solirubrobacteraceae bacterium]|nr:DUF2254 family protein [Solirubrobacteraceae bacterium]
MKDSQAPLPAVIALPAVYVGAAAALAGGLLALDAALGDSIPAVLRVGPSTAQSLLVSFAGTFLTVVAVVFWVRIYALQMSAEGLSSRVLRSFMTDRVQRHSMAFIIGTIAFVLVALRGVPDRGAGLATVPHLTVNVACLLALCVAGAVVFAVHNAVAVGRVGTLIRWQTDACVELIRATHPEAGAARLEESPPDDGGREGHPVRSTERGFVQRLDEDALLRTLPAGTRAVMGVRIGEFVMDGTTLCAIAAGADGDAKRCEESVRRTFAIGHDPTLEQDLGFGIRQLVDVAERTLSQSSRDSTTAREVVVHLGAVLRELLLRDLPAPSRPGEAGRWVVRPRATSMEEYVDAALDRIRTYGAHYPEVALTLLSTIGMLVRELDREGLADRAAPLYRQARLVVLGAEESDLLEHDVERVRQGARDAGVLEEGRGG